MQRMLFFRSLCTDTLRKFRNQERIARSKVRIGDLINLDGSDKCYRVTKIADRGDRSLGYGESWSVHVLQEYDVEKDRLIPGGSTEELLIGFSGELGDGEVTRLEEPQSDTVTSSPSSGALK